LPNSLNIALIHAADQGGGAEVCVTTLHRQLGDLGHRSRLFVASKRTEHPEVFAIERKRPVPGVLRLTRWLHQRFGWQSLYAPWFRRFDRVLGPEVDVLHLNSLWAKLEFTDLVGLRRLSRLYPTILTLHDAWMLTGHCAAPLGCDRWKTGCGSCPDLANPPAIQRDGTRLNWRRKWRALQRSDLLVTTVSSWLRDQALASPILAGKRIEVVHNGVCETTFAPGDRQAARARFGLSPAGQTLLLVTKNNRHVSDGLHIDAVNALNRLREKPFTVVVIGPQAEAFKPLLQTNAVLLGNLTSEAEMADVYRAVDFTVVPSTFETFGRVAAESQMCGTPVIAYRTGGLTDVVHPDGGGELVAPRDEAGLQDAIHRWLGAPDWVREKRERCARWSHERFATSVITQRYIDLYREVIAERVG
jgi:glycosyltransferase involved in cell wall biosynthesis